MIEGRCHCGAARFTLARPPARVTDCNCSICVRLGALWAYYPASDFSLSTPPEALGSYRCNDRVLAFRFCATCACTLFWEALPGDTPAPEGVSPRMGVNARMLVGFDPGAVEVVRFDGANL